MNEQIFPLLTMFMAFGAVAAVVYVTGQYVATEVQVRRRAGVVVEREPEAAALFTSVNTLVSTYFDEKRFSLEDSFKAKLRRDLLRAGFFHVQSVHYYIFARVVAAVLLPGFACLIALAVLETDWYVKLGFVATAFLVGNLGPSGLLSRRQRQLMVTYRSVFPDLLDLMVVCVDAGLSLEAALERISLEIMKQSRALGMNLVLLGAEMRAGRSMSDALTALADRLGLDEARSFAAMLRQSIELGTDVGIALRVFSDEMRDRRLMRAEERANQLPVKMTMPLGLFVFPVILTVIMFPVVVQLLTVFRQ